MATLDEQETTVTQLRNDKTRIYTSNPAHLRKLRADPRATEIRGDDESGFFEVAAGKYDPMKGFKFTRVMTDEQRAAASARMRSIQQKRD